ncbi:hypothetical protein GOEFS_042_00510 [Gordonia effusa NBRC 100432]|uniref:DNA repair ATPase n=1 Tax=Gordonia effusa NBRC 100432 TaxID=1077974 RepID=H0QYQ9_9ACTN|nr:DUF349 domain-containing protein [Gordonia effusa]GAB17960.1 hypothetical protein GOEFS_042_00510 [Gordonia effusa NBRC 100432]
MTESDATTPENISATPPAAPKPRPKPGPKPGPRPGGAPTPSAAASHPHPVPHGDVHKFGRVDDDGGVWLITSSGERQVGSWQAGDAEEGLAHFARRFDDLATEVEILEERLAARSGDPRKTQTAAAHLLSTLPDAAVVGDVDALAARLTSITQTADDVAASVKAEREQARTAAIAKKEELCVEAEAIGSESNQWKASGDRLRAILDEWRAIKGIDRKTDDLLWKRYAKARDAFNRRRGGHFAELDRERAGAKVRKEELIERAKELSSSTDWGPTAGKFRDLLTEWKAAGRAPRDTDDALWQQFKAAQDVFFAARNAVTAERDTEFAANADAKRELLDAAERSIDPGANLDAARREFRNFQARWDELGKVPRDQMQSLEGRARALERRIRDAEQTHWQQSDPEAQARAAQFAERAAQFEEQARKAEERGKASDARKLREQAEQWRQWADTAKSAIDG